MVKDVMLKKQIEELHEAHATTVRALKKLVTKNKKYTVADKENKNERIEKLQANMQVLWEMFQYQNEEKIQKGLRERGYTNRPDAERMLIKHVKASVSTGIKFDQFNTNREEG